MALTPKQRKVALQKGLAVNLAAADDKKYLNPNPVAASQLFTNLPQSTKELPADGRPVDVPADRQLRQTVDRQHYRQTGSKYYRQTGSNYETPQSARLPADGRPVESKEANNSTIPLAPLQWAIWEALKEADSQKKLVSYRKLAQATNASTRGVRDALNVIEREGGIQSKITVRTPDEQGMRIELNTLTPFRSASLKETKGLLKREGDYRQTVDRKLYILPADGLRLSVSINDYIKQTDIADLLKILPPTWGIRERTLIEVARSFPSMTSLEFRRSLLLLIEQVAKSQTDIQNYNAWLKAAFAKNEGPLVTQSMIEAHLDHLGRSPKLIQSKSLHPSLDDDLRGDFDALRRYLATSSDDRAVIEKAAEEAVTSALRLAPSDKHSHLREQALIEAARAFFEKRSREN